MNNVTLVDLKIQVNNAYLDYLNVLFPLEIPLDDYGNIPDEKSISMRRQRHQSKLASNFQTSTLKLNNSINIAIHQFELYHLEIPAHIAKLKFRLDTYFIAREQGLEQAMLFKMTHA